MKNKAVTIAALIIAIIGLSIGFAAFSNTLTIRSSASVNPDSSAMNVVWSSSNTAAETDQIVPTLLPNNVTNFTSTNATITGTDYRTLDNVSASFTEPGQTVTYNLFVYNAGQYPAYLTDLTFGNKSCSAITENVELANQATPSLVTQACEGISISVTIGNTTLTQSGSLNNQSLTANGGYVNARVVITYAAGSAYVDGPMSVSFGDITFTASSVQAPVVTPQEPTYSVGDVYTGDFVSTQAGVITGYQGSEASITIPDSLPVVEVSESTFNSQKCQSMMGPDWCTEAAKKYAGESNEIDNSGSSEAVETYNQALPYMLNNVYTIASATPQTITSIGMGAFMGKGIESVTFNNNITEIGMGAFMNNSITQLSIPSSVTSIGGAAFVNNDLESVTIHNTEGSVTIGEEAFPGKSEVTYVGTGQ